MEIEVVHRIKGWMKGKTIIGQAKNNSGETHLRHKNKNKCSEHIRSRMTAKESIGLLDTWSVKGVFKEVKTITQT